MKEFPFTTSQEEGMKEFPLSIYQEIKNYINYGRKPGYFLYAMLSNDFVETIYKTHQENLHLLLKYVQFIDWEMPQESWGSYKKVDEWIEIAGLEGLKKRKGF